METSEVALASVKLIQKRVDLLEIPADTREFIFLDYDAKTLQLRYLATVSPEV